MTEHQSGMTTVGGEKKKKKTNEGRKGWTFLATSHTLYASGYDATGGGDCENVLKVPKESISTRAEQLEKDLNQSPEESTFINNKNRHIKCMRLVKSQMAGLVVPP